MSSDDPRLPPSPGHPRDDEFWAEVDKELGTPAGGVERTAESNPEPSSAGDAAGPDGAEDAPPTDVMPPVEAHPHPRVSHTRYVVRRLIVALCALLVLGGIIGLIVWMVDDDDGEAQNPPATSTNPETTEAAAVATTEPAETTEAVATTESPATTDGADPTPAGDAAATSGPDGTAAATSAAEATTPATQTSAVDGTSPETTIGDVEYDLDSEPSCEIFQELERGDAGPQVQCLQERLNEVTVVGPQIATDGAFGEQTDAAVRRFQEENELTADGIAGPATAELLGIWSGPAG